MTDKGGRDESRPYDAPVVAARFIAPVSRTAPSLARIGRLLPTVAFLAVVLLGWELAVRLWQVPAFLLPSPSAVGARLMGDPMFFGREGLITLGEALGGLAIGGVLALGASLLMAQWRWLERALLPVLPA